MTPPAVQRVAEATGAGHTDEERGKQERRKREREKQKSDQHLDTRRQRHLDTVHAVCRCKECGTRLRLHRAYRPLRGVPDLEAAAGALPSLEGTTVRCEGVFACYVLTKRKEGQ